MTPGQLSLAARDAVALRLPSVLKQDGQDRARDLAAQLQPLLEHGKQIPAALLASWRRTRTTPGSPRPCWRRSARRRRTGRC
jgi:hypothetical protein